MGKIKRKRNINVKENVIQNNRLDLFKKKKIDDQICMNAENVKMC